MKSVGTKAVLWRCPVCGREFAHPNQWHSHAGRPVETHFQGRPEARKIYDELIKKLEEFGPLRTDAVKTSINLIARRHLGGVRVQEDGLRVGFVLERKLSDPRILRAEWVGGTKYGHSVKVTSAEELDEQLLGWLKEAYGLAS
jgi:hypothetical protein